MQSSISSLTISFLALLLFPMRMAAQDQGDAVVHSFSDEDLKWGGCPDFMPESCSIAVLQGNPEKPNTNIFFKLKGNTKVPDHWHHSAERMVLVSGKMNVKYKGQQVEVMEAGNYGYGPAKRPHKASCVSESPCILFIALESP